MTTTPCPRCTAPVILARDAFRNRTKALDRAGYRGSPTPSDAPPLWWAWEAAPSTPRCAPASRLIVAGLSPAWGAEKVLCVGHVCAAPATAQEAA